MRKSLAETVAAQVRAEMASQQRKSQSLAAELRVSDMWVSRRLRGRTAISLSDLERIATALGRPVDRFLPTPERAA